MQRYEKTTEAQVREEKLDSTKRGEWKRAEERNPDSCVDNNGHNGEEILPGHGRRWSDPLVVERSAPRRVNLAAREDEPVAGGRHRAARRQGRETDAAEVRSLPHAPAASTFPWKCRGRGAEVPTASSRPCHATPRYTHVYGRPRLRHQDTAPTHTRLSSATHVTQRRQRANGGLRRARKKASLITYCHGPRITARIAAAIIAKNQYGFPVHWLVDGRIID